MDEARLAELEKAFDEAEARSGTDPNWAMHMGLIVRDAFPELLAEVRRLRAQVAGHAERIAAQSELLSKQAERT